MENVPIQGGRTVGPPRDWDAEAKGECLNLSVLTTSSLDGMMTTWSGWKFSDLDLAFLAQGGHFILGVVLPYIPVLQLVVQDGDGRTVSELRAAPTGVHPIQPPTSRQQLETANAIGATFRAAIITIGAALECRIKGWPDQRLPACTERWKALGNADLIEKLAGLVPRVPFAAGNVASVRVMKLDDIAGEMTGKTPSSVVTDDIQSELEKQLGVNLNPNFDADDQEGQDNG